VSDFLRSIVSSQVPTVRESNSSAFEQLDLSSIRRKVSGLFKGGKTTDGSSSSEETDVKFVDSAGATTNDWRVKISLADASTIFYKDPTNLIMGPLVRTNGVVFPYTPTFSITHMATYNSQNLTHSNYTPHTYTSSDVSGFNITGDFTVSNEAEGRYLIAAIYFFRAATKMFFGSGQNVGSPPPIVFLDGYGEHYFPHVPCVLTSFTHSLGSDIDYLEINVDSTEEVDFEETVNDSGTATLYELGDGTLTSNRSAVYPDWSNNGKLIPKNVKKTRTNTISKPTRVPTQSQISIELRPVYSRKNLHDNFDLNKFAKGQLLSNKRTGMGGFI
jgi:hypothetical protein